jgi:hypothetical protein
MGSNEKLFKAAAEANVRWIIPNLFGTDSSDAEAESATRMQFESQRSVIEDLGLNWTGVACSFWYVRLPNTLILPETDYARYECSLAGTSDRYGFDFPKKKVIFYDNGETKIHTSTFPQVARAVTSLLSLPMLLEDENDKTTTLSSTFRNKLAHIASFRISQKDMLASVLRVTSTKESDWSISYEPSKERFERPRDAMIAGDLIAFGSRLYARCFFPKNTLCNFDKHGLDNEALGLPKESLDEFTRVAVDMASSDYFAVKDAKIVKEGGNKVGMAAYGKED